jgi:hypothetical protein
MIMYRAHPSLVDLDTMVRLVIVQMLLSLPAFAGVSDDARLAPVKAQLDQAYTAAARDGVPVSLLDDKLAEGLAKNVPPARLAAFIGTYETRLTEAAALAKTASTPALLKAIVEARAAGATGHDLEPLVARGAHAVDVLTDLAQRGFPPAQAASIVAKVASKNPRQLDRLAAVAQSLAARLGPVEALDAIGRAADRGLGPDRAPDFAGRPDDRGPNRDTSGQRGPGFQHGKGKP